MANNTVLNPGAGGDTLRTDDVTTSKIPVSKIATGAAGVDGGVVTAANPFQVVIASGSQGVSVTGVSLNTMPQSGSVTGLLIGGQAVNAANPVPTKPQSGSLTGLLVGGVALSQANPLPINQISGSVTGLLVGGVPVSSANPMPVGSAWDQSGQLISGSIVRTVQYSFSDAVSGSANQIVAPQGANNRIRVIAAQVMNPAAASIRWISTGSVGTINNISSIATLPANGGYVLPFNPHGWFQTNANEGLNAAVNMAGGATVGINVTWIIVGP